MIDLFQWDYFLRDSRSTDIKIMFNYDRLITNMKVMDWEHADYGIIKRIVYKDKVVGECQVIIKIKSNPSVIPKLLFLGNVL